MPAPTPAKPADAVGRADPAALRRKTFDCACSFKADGDDPNGEFDLYAAVFSNVDRQAEVIQPGAFANLSEFAADGVGLVNHGMMQLPVAWIDSAVQDAKGLRVRGRFHSTPEAQACRTVVVERMAAGKSVKCSIGYRIDDYAIEKADGGRSITRIKSLRVYEFSFVNVPANPQAGVTSAKSATHAEAPMPESEHKPTFIEAVKEWMGLSTKKGRAISKANHAALSTFADGMKDGGAKLIEHAKGLKAHGAAMCKLGDEMVEHLKAFGPAVDPEADPDDDAEPGVEADDPDDAARRKALRDRLRRS